MALLCGAAKAAYGAKPVEDPGEKQVGCTVTSTTGHRAEIDTLFLLI